MREWETVIVTTGESQGRTKIEGGGRKIQAMEQVNKSKYYDYLLQQWAR
ncbi:MAG: hypothetical protein KME06_04645 [Kastovskya adunca ATA6-11-RM4]|nr:hypothetical protein [Kastovskya adunca ATA6-11-RM4]